MKHTLSLRKSLTPNGWAGLKRGAARVLGIAALTCAAYSSNAQYCSSAATSTADEDITNVIWGTWSNPHACGALAPGTGSLAFRYSNYTTITGPSAIVGQTYTIGARVTSCGTFAYSGIFVMWIDYNDNGNFTDAGETLYTSTYMASALTTGTTQTTSYTVPLTVTPGVHRMRIIYNESTIAPTSCQNPTWGETEDYLITIVANTPCAGAPVLPTPTPSVTPSQTTYCGSASPTLSITPVSAGNITYQWQSSPTGATWTNITGATNTSYAVPGITASMLYRVVVTCNNAPVASTTSNAVLINVAPNPVVSANANPVQICQGGSTTITGSGATSYSWAPGGQTTQSITVSPTSTTSYTVTGTLGSCSATAVAAVAVGTPFTITPVTATPASVCSGGSTVLSANVPVGSTAFCTPSYSFGTGAGDFIQSVVMPTTTLTNTTGAGPSPYYQLFPTSGSTTASLTAGNTYTINVTTGTYSSNDVAVWIDYNGNGLLDDAGEKLGEIDNLGSGGVASFTFTIPSSTFSGIHRLRVMEADQGTTGGMTPCAAQTFGEVEDYNVTINSAFAFSTITWTESLGGGTTLSVTNNSPVTATNITTNKTYNISVSKNGCTATGSVNVTANPLPTATMTTSTSTVCAGQQPSITITGTPNTNVVYSINGVNQTAVSTGGSGSVTFNVPAISVATAYALVSVTNPATTCSSTLSGGFTVNVNERPAGVFLGSSTVCKDNPAFIGFGSPSGAGVFPIYVTFTDGTNTYTDTAYGAGENFPVPSDVPGIYNYTLSTLTSGANGCTAIAGDMNGTAMMEIKALPTAVVTSVDPGVCPGGTTTVDLTFTGDAPFNFNYFDGSVIQGGSSATNTFSFPVTPAVATDYYVTDLLDNNFCVATPSDLADSTTVMVYDETAITSQPIAAITTCSETDATITMSAIGENLTYTWFENGVQVSGPNYTVNDNILTINNVTGLDGYQYYVVVHSDCGADQTSTSTTINEDHTNNWSGTVSTDWNNATNWSCGSVPIMTTDVMIPVTAPFQPMVEIPNAVCHDITLIGGASLTFMTGMQLSVYGDIMNTTGGTINGTGGKVVLAGTVQNAAGPLTLDDLDVDGGGVKTFTNDVTVNGILNLVSGNIELGTANLTLTQPTAQTGGGPSSFIVTNGTGKVTGNNMGAVGGNPDAVTFHVGINNSSYTPMTLENLGDADDFSVRVMENVYEDGTGVIPSEVDNPVVDRTWLVSEGTVGGSYVTMTPAWNSPVEEVNNFDQTHVYVAHYMGGEWTRYVDSAEVAPAADPGPFAGMLQTTQDSIMSFSPFTVASNGQFPLSIHLSSIVATNVGPRNKVQWTSAKEDAGDVYELESSADGRKFTKIATVAAKGEASSYLQWDENPVQGVNYYRVKLLNNDGTYSYSKVVTATVKGKDGFSIEAYPNPVKNMVSVKVDGVVAGNAKVVVTDVTGKVVKVATAVVNNGAELNVSDLAAGVYLLNYSDDNRNESIKITKQ